jgi:hypothetical protein
MLFILARRLRLSRPAAGAAVLISRAVASGSAVPKNGLPRQRVPPVVAGRIRLWRWRHRGSLPPSPGLHSASRSAVLSKETDLLFLPFLGWQMWRMADRGTRRYTVSMAAAIVVVLGLCYVLMATLKGELVPGTNRVSLASGIGFQLLRAAVEWFAFSVRQPSARNARTLDARPGDLGGRIPGCAAAASKSTFRTHRIGDRLLGGVRAGAGATCRCRTSLRCSRSLPC